MRVFKQGNWRHGAKCPICNTNKKEEVVLIGIVGTEEDNIIEGKQFHLSCLELLFDEKLGIIYQKVILCQNANTNGN